MPKREVKQKIGRNDRRGAKTDNRAGRLGRSKKVSSAAKNDPLGEKLSE